MSHNSLEAHYKNMFNLAHNYKFSTITELENFIPFELDVYMSLIKDDLEIKQERANQQRLMQDALSNRRY